MTLDPNNVFLLACFAMKAGLVPAVWGPPGCGKTALTPLLARSLGYLPADDDGDFYNRAGFVSVAMSYVVPEDISGLPVKGEENTVVRLHDSHIVMACENPCLFVVDEANRFVSQAAANVALRLYQERMAGDRCLHSGTSIILLMNGVTSEGARELSPALANRLCHLVYTPDSSDFISYLSGGNGVLPVLPDNWPEVGGADIAAARSMVASFLRANPLKAHSEPGANKVTDKPWGRDICGPWASWRSWDNFARVIALVGKFGDIRKPIYADIVHNLGLGIIGNVASEFHNFLTKSDLRSGAEVLDTPGVYIVPRRIDILWAEAMSASVEARRRNTLAAWHTCLDVYRAIDKHGMAEVPAIALPFLLGCNKDGVGLSSVFAGDLINQPDIRKLFMEISKQTGIYK